MVTKTVTGNGTGDYNCDGTNDQVQINYALAWANANPNSTIWIKGPFTYDIQDYLLIGSYTTLKFDSSAVLRLANWIGWAQYKPLICGLVNPLYNVEIYGGEIDGNYANEPVALNNGYYPFIVLVNATNVNIHDMNLHDGAGHGISISGTNIICHSNTIKNLGGDACQIIGSNAVDVYGNTILVRGNSGVHIQNTANSLVHNNYIMGLDDSTGGVAGIIIEDTDGTTVYPDIYDNVILDSYGAGILIIESYVAPKKTPKHLHCHRNIMRGCGKSREHDFNSGCCYQGFDGGSIEYNTFDSCYNAGIFNRYPSTSDGCNMTCNNNTITNTKKHENPVYQYNYSGFGIVNNNSLKSTMTLSNNVLYNNVGNYFGVNGAGDVTAIPNIQQYIPPTSYIQDEVANYYLEGRTAYINGYPFRWQNKKIDMNKSIGQEKPPGLDGWCLEDFGFEGSNITLDCYAYSLEEMRNTIAAFYQPGKAILELGGIYEGWRISGITANHSTDLKLSKDVPERAYPYSILFLADKAIMESNTKKIRTKKLTDHAQTWESSDCYPGDRIKNGNFHTWATWIISMKWYSHTSAADNNWTSICWSPGLGVYVAVANSGVGNRVMTSGDGITWYTHTSAADNNWTSVCWSPTLNFFVAVASSGTGNRVMTSMNGTTWYPQTSAADYNWTSVCWSPGLGIFVAVSNSGTYHRIMSSSNGTAWTLQSSTADNDWSSVCWSPEKGIFVAVSTTGTYQVMTSGNGTTWTPHTTPVQAWTSVCWSPYLGLFAAVSSNGTTQQVITSPDGITWTPRNTPETCQWTSICWSSQYQGTFIAVANSGEGSRVMASVDGIHWYLQIASTDNNWTSVCYSPTRTALVAVASSGVGNRVMNCSGVDCALSSLSSPTDWEYRKGGQILSDDTFSGLNSYKIIGNGRTNKIGYCAQSVKFETGIQYVMTATGKISNLTQGKLHCGIYSGETQLYGLDFTENTDWTTKNEVNCTFDEDQTDAELRIYGDNYVNDGANMYCDQVVVVRAKHYDSDDLGSDIITSGTIDCIPDIMVTATRLTSGVITEGFNLKTIDYGGTYEINGNSYSLIHTDVLPAKSHKRHRIDKVSCRHCSDSSSYAGYTKCTYQCASLNYGAETLISELGTNTQYPTYEDFHSSPFVTCGENESCTVRYYGKSSNSGHHSKHKDIVTDHTEIITNALGTGIQIYNTADPLTVMQVCNKLAPGSSMEINADGTGSYRYTENLADITYQNVAYSRSNDTYDTFNKLLTLSTSGNVIYRFDTRYPVTGIPHMVLDVISGCPQISIATEDTGAPGTYYAIDSNSFYDESGNTIYRELVQLANLSLKGSTVFYVRITPYPNQSCVINSIFLYSDIVTIDAERPKIFANGKANTFKVNMPNNTALEVSLQYRDAHRMI